MDKRRCIGFGLFKGHCNNPAGHPKQQIPANKIWCLRCDCLRIAYLSKCFDKLANSLRETAQQKEGEK